MTIPRQSDRVGEGQNRIEACWMCGIHQPAAQMIADGGVACADVRWYCRDLRACTERWAAAGWPRPGGARRFSGGSGRAGTA